MSEQIRVLEVLEATVGGTRRHLVSLVAHLDRSRFAVEVAAPSVRHGTEDDTRFVEEIKATGAPIHFVDMVREIRPLTDLKSFWQLFRLIHKRDYHLVHLHSSKAGFLGRIVAKLHGLPTVYTPNGFYFLDARNPVKGKLFLLLERMVGFLTDRLIAVSESEQKSAIEHQIVPAEHIVTIPNGIDIDCFLPDKVARDRTRMELGIGPEMVVVGTVSRYIPQKDPFTLVHAMHLIWQQEPETRFIWCGEGEMRPQAEQLAYKLGIHEAIYFLGFRHDVKDIMNAFDIFVLASVFEGLPYTLLEIMALGLPVVATNVVGTRDLVIHNKTGLLVPPENPAELAHVVVKLLQDRNKCQEYGANAREIMRSCYDIKHMVDDISTVYETLVSTNRR